jgi:6-phosphogluconate dehydrogenase
MAEENSADVGLMGLAVMGQNLALNMADHGFEVAVFNRTSKVTKDFVDANPNTPGGLVACENLSDLLGAVKKPRKIVILVKAGPAVDDVVKQLIEAGIEKEDLLVDCGNSQWTDTILNLFRSLVLRFRSSGKIGARFGPSLCRAAILRHGNFWSQSGMRLPPKSMPPPASRLKPPHRDGR